MDRAQALLEHVDLLNPRVLVTFCLGAVVATAILKSARFIASALLFVTKVALSLLVLLVTLQLFKSSPLYQDYAGYMLHLLAPSG